MPVSRSLGKSGAVDRGFDQYRAGSGFPDGRHQSWGVRASVSRYHLGRGSIVMRGQGRIRRAGAATAETIIISEIPYQVNKAHLVERIGELVRDREARRHFRSAR